MCKAVLLRRKNAFSVESSPNEGNWVSSSSSTSWDLLQQLWPYHIILQWMRSPYQSVSVHLQSIPVWSASTTSGLSFYSNPIDCLLLLRLLLHWQGYYKRKTWSTDVLLGQKHILQAILLLRASVFSALFNEPKKGTKTTERQFLDTGFALKLNVIFFLCN